MYPKQTTPLPALAQVLSEAKNEAIKHGAAASRITISERLFKRWAKLLQAAGYEQTGTYYKVELNERTLHLLQPGAGYDRYSACTYYTAEDGRLLGSSIPSAVAIMLNERPARSVAKLTNAELKRLYDYLAYDPSVDTFGQSLRHCLLHANEVQIKALLVAFPELIHKAFK